ncbi:NUDIX hydrolase [Sporosarcina thermotolerans]|uniref:NUDIX hydrolase n=1 Tax=Sporosarcina thermotolerans TaxID=633404 RepID=A0AAW9A6V0_9BACL|nr:NUDIX hydrolase [Sporosarcina thermotolerans]MDW0115954.1 NUDIX hydrolase [Sporosarcina thermotolerans]
MGYIKELRKLIGSRPIIMAGANVIVVNEEDQLLLQLRIDNNCWGLPGGSMELGESLEDVAKRELYEETNLTANELSLFNVYSGEELYYRYPHGDEVYNVVTTFICKSYSGELIADKNEVSSLRFFSTDELPSNISPPDLPILTDYTQNHRGTKVENFTLE